MPGHDRPPVVPDEQRLVFAQRIENTDDIGSELADIVILDSRRSVGAAIAAHIRRHHPIPGLGQRLNLVPPGEPGFRPTMHHDHQRPGLARCRQTHADTIDLLETKADTANGSL